MTYFRVCLFFAILCLLTKEDGLKTEQYFIFDISIPQIIYCSESYFLN